jgi:hypothetical protein
VAKGKNGVQVEVRVDEFGDQMCSKHGDSGIGWRGKENRAID